MGKTILVISSLVFLLGISPAGQAVDGPNESRVGLVVELQDGSRIRGAVHLDSLRLSSPAIGGIEVPISKVRRITFRDSQEAPRVFLINGDILTGTLALSELEMQTLIGKITITLKVVVSW